MAGSSMSDTLRDVAELLSGEGERLGGFAGDAAEAKAMVILRPPWKPYCIVRDWMLIEIAVADEFRESLAGDGLQPYVLYASNVLSHSMNKRLAGDWFDQLFSARLVAFYLKRVTPFTSCWGRGCEKKPALRRSWQLSSCTESHGEVSNFFTETQGFLVDSAAFLSRCCCALHPRCALSFHYGANHATSRNVRSAC